MTRTIRTETKELGATAMTLVALFLFKARFFNNRSATDIHIRFQSLNVRALVYINIVVWLMHLFVLFLLYQGVLGVRKLQISITSVDENEEPKDEQKQ